MKGEEVGSFDVPFISSDGKEGFIGAFEEIQFVKDGSAAPAEFLFSDVEELSSGEFIVIGLDNLEEFFRGEAGSESFIDSFDFSWVEISSDHDRSLPADDEGIDRRMVADGKIESKGEMFLVFGQGDDVIGVTDDGAGTGDAIFGFFCGLVAFGEMDTESAGDILLVDGIE